MRTKKDEKNDMITQRRCGHSEKSSFEMKIVRYICIQTTNVEGKERNK